MRQRTGISIDWDYFIPENPMWDLGHVESFFYLEMIWLTRGWLIDRMKLDSSNEMFWETIGEVFDLTLLSDMTVSESHAFAINDADLMLCQHIVLFDAHHDCWAYSEPGRVGCDSWARHWLEEGSDRELTWVTPAWLDASIYGPIDDDIADRVRIVPDSELSQAMSDVSELQALHVCRSGCWTPPWFDRAFNRFLAGLQLPILLLQADDWDATRERWSDEDVEAALGLNKAMEAHRATLLSLNEGGQ